MSGCCVERGRKEERATRTRTKDVCVHDCEGLRLRRLFNRSTCKPSQNISVCPTSHRCQQIRSKTHQS